MFACGWRVHWVSCFLNIIKQLNKYKFYLLHSFMHKNTVLCAKGNNSQAIYYTCESEWKMWNKIFHEIRKWNLKIYLVETSTCVDNFQPDVFKFSFLGNQVLNIFFLHFVCAANNLLSIIHFIIQIQACIYLPIFKRDFLKNEILLLFSFFFFLSLYYSLSSILRFQKHRVYSENN